MRNANIGRNEDDLEFGVIIGRRSLDEREDNALLCRGSIELWHDKQLVIAEIFKSKVERKRIINKWYMLYKLNAKTNVYFHVKYKEC